MVNFEKRLCIDSYQDHFVQCTADRARRFLAGQLPVSKEIDNSVQRLLCPVSLSVASRN